MRLIMRASFKQNPDVYDALTKLYSENDVFTHNQDRGIWREEFPKILKEIATDA